MLTLLLPFFCVQKEYHAEKIWLFSKIQYPGNVSVDRNGKRLQKHPTKLFCYLKVSRKIESPNWQTAIIYGNDYAVEAVPVNQDSVIVGTLKNTNSAVTIKAGAQSKIIQLVLTQQRESEKPEAWKFVLNGTLNGKAVYIRSNEPLVELSPDMMP
jgi:hypothetical protein